MRQLVMCEQVTIPRGCMHVLYSAAHELRQPGEVPELTIEPTGSHRISVLVRQPLCPAHRRGIAVTPAQGRGCSDKGHKVRDTVCFHSA